MESKRHITPGGPVSKRTNPRLLLKQSLVSDRLGAQGFLEAPAGRDGERPRAAQPRLPESPANN